MDVQEPEEGKICGDGGKRASHFMCSHNWILSSKRSCMGQTHTGCRINSTLLERLSANSIDFLFLRLWMVCGKKNFPRNGLARVSFALAPEALWRCRCHSPQRVHQYSTWIGKQAEGCAQIFVSALTDETVFASHWNLLNSAPASWAVVKPLTGILTHSLNHIRSSTSVISFPLPHTSQKLTLYELYSFFCISHLLLP